MIELSRRIFNYFSNLQIIIGYYLAVTPKRNQVNMQKIDLYIIACVGARHFNQCHRICWFNLHMSSNSLKFVKKTRMKMYLSFSLKKRSNLKMSLVILPY